MAIRLLPEPYVPHKVSLDALFVQFIQRAERESKRAIDRLEVPLSRDNRPSPYSVRTELRQYVGYKTNLLWKLFGADVISEQEIEKYKRFVEIARTNMYRRFKKVDQLHAVIFIIDGEFDSIYADLLAPLES